jgi:myo-inositol-1(or 4)-monophosphatase
MNLSEDLKLARQLAREAGDIVRELYGKTDRLTKTHAAAKDEAVTEADRAAQRLIVAGLRKHCPNDGIIGEESDSGESITFECNNPAGRNWVIDPIDGTNNFIAGLGAFAVCIGLLDRGEPILGVVYDVTRDQMYSAARGLGAWRDERGIEAPRTPLGNAALIMMASNLLDGLGACPPWAIRWLSQTDWKLRILGSAALEAVQVAAGIAHCAVTINGKLWDCVAPAAIVLEAGGIISDLRGRAVFPFELKNYTGAKVPFIASGKTAHAQLVRELANERGSR